MIRAFLILGLTLAGSAASALTLAACDRTTHISHAGETSHQDLSEGRVMWQRWWSQEGTSTDVFVMECGSGETLSFRTAEENISDRLPFDRTQDALKVVADHHQGARLFATLPRLVDALGYRARDARLTIVADQSCACAALYPELRGDKSAFDSASLMEAGE